MMEQKYNHLVVSYNPPRGRVVTPIGTVGRYKYAIKKFLALNPFVYGMANRFKQFCHGLECLRNAEESTKKHIELMKEDQGGTRANSFGSSYGYKNEWRELEVVLKYQKEILDGNINAMASESGALYKHLEEVLTEFLTLHPKVKTFVNFGVSYAHIDNILAKKFPNVKFIGIDRSQLTRAYNEVAFSNFKNMKFIATDILQYLRENNLRDTVFFHARTANCLPKSFLEILYAALAQSQCCYIAGVEQIGISRQTKEPYKFSDEDQPSVVFRSFMYIHNYPCLLQKYGYQFKRSELVKTNHPHEDYRFLSFIAEKA